MTKRGSTVTVFAPYDCNNGCPFCINKAEYAHIKYSIERTIDSMWKMHEVTPECDFVFTGGEPLADLGILNRLLIEVLKMNGGETHHNLFINTTLPFDENKYKDFTVVIDFLNSWRDVITGLNVSRHLKKYVKEIDDVYFEKLELPVRINCVLYEKDWTREQLVLHINRFKNYNCVQGFQFRDNYTLVNEENLFRDENLNLYRLAQCLRDYRIGEEVYIYREETFRWDVEITHNPLVKFHRTLPYSKIVNKEKGLIEINDVIINQEGYIYDDWNGYGKPLDMDEYVLFLHDMLWA